MRDYINIGPSPCEEECVQLGSDNYRSLAREECSKFIQAIRQKLGEEPEGAELRTKSFPHDFGTYLEVVCWFDDEVPESFDYALACESDSPTTWADTKPFDWRGKKDLAEEKEGLRNIRLIEALASEE
jgi:hypothetical protein